jgi:hypothetical protein
MKKNKKKLPRSRRYNVSSPAVVVVSAKKPLPSSLSIPALLSCLPALSLAVQVGAEPAAVVLDASWAEVVMFWTRDGHSGGSRGCCCM